MTWARFDDQRADHPKLLAAGLEARGMDEAGICWCAGKETDGYIPEVAVRMLAAGHGCTNWRRPVKRLVDVGRWEPADGGWVIHDFLDYNPSKADRDAERARKSEAGRQGGMRSGESRRKQAASEEAKHSPKEPASEPANSRPGPTRPGPTRLPQQPSDEHVHPRPGEPSAAAAEEDLLNKALRIVAKRNLDAKTEKVHNPTAWLCKAIEGMRVDLAAVIGDLDLSRFPSAEELADYLAPSHTPRPVDPSELTGAAALSYVVARDAERDQRARAIDVASCDLTHRTGPL